LYQVPDATQSRVPAGSGPRSHLLSNIDVKDLAANIGRLQEIIRRCTLCPRRCGVDRPAGQVGACGISAQAVVSSAGPHFGEEPVLVGKGGSGTIFFAGCNLDCVFCQNDDIRHGVPDYPAVATASLAEMYRQVGTLKTDGRGVATRGVLVQHLVMPGDLARSRDVIDIVARAAPGCAINVMGQYHPAYRAGEFPELMAPVPHRTIEELREYAASQGLPRVD